MRKGQDGSYMNLPVAGGVLGSVQHLRLYLCMQTHMSCLSNRNVLFQLPFETRQPFTGWILE